MNQDPFNKIQSNAYMHQLRSCFVFLTWAIVHELFNKLVWNKYRALLLLLYTQPWQREQEPDARPAESAKNQPRIQNIEKWLKQVLGSGLKTTSNLGSQGHNHRK